jgi:high-affinity iron transporter
MGAAFLASYLIGLRDGLEAALVVSILAAYLVKAERRDQLRHMWTGVGAAITVAALFGVVLTYIASTLLSGVRLEIFEAVTSLAAVALVTWMIFWMRRTARTLKGELTGRLDRALTMGATAVALMAFFAVVREGVEMVLLVFAAVQGAVENAAPLLGVLTGVVTAALLGWLLYSATARINLSRFFTWTGALLVVVAAGILKYGVHGFQEAGILPGGADTAFDLTATIPPTSWYAALFAGTVNLTPRASVLEIVAWVGFAVVVLVLFFRPARDPAPTRS